MARNVFLFQIELKTFAENLQTEFEKLDNNKEMWAEVTNTVMAMQEKTLERVVLPLSGLTSWMMVLVGGLMAMHVLGINIQPLLTVGGVSGIIVGLSAQSVLGNLISGINLVRLLTHTAARWVRHWLMYNLISMA